VGVTQSTSPWVSNISQFGGNNVVTGTGTSGVGIPRVTVSNDSNILATQSGTWTVAQGSPNSLANGWPVEVTDGTNILGTAAHPIRIDPTGTTIQPVSGTVSATQGTSPWVSNITQFGSNNVVTGTGTSGAGIPRVTVSNDSNILATQSGTWTVAQGSPNSLANGWPVKITDGTNTMPTGDAVGRAIFEKITDGTNTAAVKAASTAVAATDPALVVAVSQNTPVLITTISSTATSGLAFGQANTGGTANTLVSLRGTTYTEQTTNAQRSLKSTSTNDASAGTGARQVKITYYDQTMAGPFTETVTLNGTTAVNTVSATICFIEKMIVISVGSTKSNQGTITLFTTTGGGGTAIGTIAVGNIVSAGTVGDNQTLWSHHYVATGKTDAITTISSGTTGNQSGVTFLRFVDPTSATSVDTQITESLATVSASGSGSVFRVAGIPIKITGPARITQYVVSNGTNTVFYGGFEYTDA
jgi:hypothetical protein